MSILSSAHGKNLRKQNRIILSPLGIQGAMGVCANFAELSDLDSFSHIAGARRTGRGKLGVPVGGDEVGSRCPGEFGASKVTHGDGKSDRSKASYLRLPSVRIVL